jgi:hypothetical protein
MLGARMGLVQRRVAIVISDPWDFVSANGAEFLGTTVEDREQELVLELDQAISCSGNQPSAVLLSRPRHTGVDMQALAVGAEVACNLVAISAEAPPAWSASNVLCVLVGSLRFDPGSEH